MSQLGQVVPYNNVTQVVPIDGYQPIGEYQAYTPQMGFLVQPDQYAAKAHSCNCKAENTFPAIFSLLVPGAGQRIKGEQDKGLAYSLIALAGWVATWFSSSRYSAMVEENRAVAMQKGWVKAMKEAPSEVSRHPLVKYLTSFAEKAPKDLPHSSKSLFVTGFLGATSAFIALSTHFASAKDAYKSRKPVS